MEELLLRPLLAGDELDVVDEQEVDVPVAPPKLRRAVVADRVDQLVGEPLGGDVDDDHSREQLGALVADRVQEMRLAQADPAVDEEGVVGLRGQLGYCLTGGLGKLVRGPDDEGVEGVARIQPLRGSATRARCERRRRRVAGRGLLGGLIDDDRDPRLTADHALGRLLERLKMVLDQPVT